MATEIITARYASPVGELLLASCGEALCMCDWVLSARHNANLRRLRSCLGVSSLRDGVSDVVRLAISQLDEYFAGARAEFSLPIAMSGTPFQCAVWQLLLSIPYGSVVSYMDVAQCLGRPGSVRAVAAAIGSNPMSIVVPCHRVVGRGGKLTGYAGGLAAKRYLLDLERGVAAEFHLKNAKVIEKSVE